MSGIISPHTQEGEGQLFQGSNVKLAWLVAPVEAQDLSGKHSYNLNILVTIIVVKT